ncbi:MAG: BamA/TamA family outer membrane protein [Cyclobacteriaceae bacterium]
MAVYPAAGYQPETSFQIGAIAVVVVPSNNQSGYDRPTSITPFVLYTFKNQVLSAINADIFFKNGINLEISPRYFNYPDNYYGIGNDNDPDAFEKYTNRFWQLEGRLFKPLNDKTFVGLSFDLQNNKLKDLEEGGRLDSELINGVDGGNNIGIGPAFKYDSRDNTLYPTDGYLISAQVRTSQLGDFSYTNYQLDFRKYLSFGSDKNVLAFNVNTNFTSGDNVPFYKLPQLGGDERLRGIANASLYRDKQSFYAQTEYRRHLFWRVGVVAFLGVGDVAEIVSDYNFNEFKYVAGVGYRFAAIKDQKLNLRFDFGVSRGGQTAFYLGMREAF